MPEYTAVRSPTRKLFSTVGSCTLLQGLPQLVDKPQNPLFYLLKAAPTQVQSLGQFLDQDLAARQNVNDFHGLSPLPNKDHQGGDRPFSLKTQCRKTRS
jgi:hypothetical protein